MKSYYWQKNGVFFPSFITWCALQGCSTWREDSWVVGLFLKEQRLELSVPPPPWVWHVNSLMECQTTGFSPWITFNMLDKLLSLYFLFDVCYLLSVKHVKMGFSSMSWSCLSKGVLGLVLWNIWNFWWIHNMQTGMFYCWSTGLLCYHDCVPCCIHKIAWLTQASL